MKLRQTALPAFSALAIAAVMPSGCEGDPKGDPEPVHCQFEVTMPSNIGIQIAPAAIGEPVMVNLVKSRKNTVPLMATEVILSERFDCNDAFPEIFAPVDPLAPADTVFSTLDLDLKCVDKSYEISCYEDP